MVVLTHPEYTSTTSGFVKILRYTPLAKERYRIPWECVIILILVTVTSSKVVTFDNNLSMDDQTLFPHDILTPYPQGRHGSTRTTRDVSSCQHSVWENRTYEEHHMTPHTQWSQHTQYEVLKFADVVHHSPLRRRYAVGSIAKIDDPYYAFSILEPKEIGGCEKKYFYAEKNTVQETAKRRQNGCHLAANAGFFNVASGECLGNIVTSGRIVQSTNSTANANFGIRQNGSIVVGYISDEEIHNEENPFRQLVSGIIWLVRNGTNYVNESMILECSDNEDTGSMKTFVEVLSARTAIGHDDKGRLILAHVEGQTHTRGASLYEFADLLIRKGVVNAINLDGGGSSTFVQDGLLMNYPSDHCYYDGKYRCPREVSTIVCIHDPECLEANCSQHGSCDKGACTCDEPWIGETCNVFNCTIVDCSGNGNCTEGKCQCDAGWTGHFCNESCSSNHYGPGCAQWCSCYGKSICDPVSGNCTCPAGWTGEYGCWKECSEGLYGQDCLQKCDYPDCSDHGYCSKVTGLCICKEGWSGIACNDSVISSTIPSLSSLETTPINSISLGLSRNDPLLSLSYTSIQSVSMVTPVTMVVSPSYTSIQSVAIVTSPLVTTHMHSISCYSDNVSNSTRPLSPSNIDYTSTIVIATIFSLVTILVHVLLCVCNHQRSNNGPSMSRAEIRREIMEKREWERMMEQMGTNWNSDSD